LIKRNDEIKGEGKILKDNIPKAGNLSLKVIDGLMPC